MVDAKFLQSLGNAGMNTSVQLANQALADLFDTLGSRNKDVFKQKMSASNMPVLAYGGKPKMSMGGVIPVNAEDKEVITSPYNNKGITLNGKSHAQGGINIDLPEGSAVFSKKLKFEGKSFAQRKNKRDKQLAKAEKSYKNYNKRDAFTLDRMKNNTRMTDDIELFIQDLMSQSKGYKDGKRIKAENGLNGTDPLIGPRKPYYIEPLPQQRIPTSISELIGDYKLPTVPRSTEPSFLDKLFNSSITQNERGNIAQQLGSFAPAAMTLANRAGDTPNINPYKDVGNKALSLMQQARRSQASAGKAVNADIQAKFAGSRNTINQGSSSINQLRNLNLVNDAVEARTIAQTNMDLIGRLGQIDANIGQTQMSASTMEAQGEQIRDTADRQDRDAFYTNFGRDLQSAATGQMIGAKNMNEEAYQNEIRDLIDQYRNKRIDYVTFNNMMGSILQKLGISNNQ